MVGSFQFGILVDYRDYRDRLIGLGMAPRGRKGYVNERGEREWESRSVAVAVDVR